MLKLTGKVLLSAAVLAGMLVLWNHWDFARRSGRADAGEAVHERKMWDCVVSMHDRMLSFLQKHSVGFKNKDGSLSEKKQELAELQSWAEVYMQQQRRQKRRLTELRNSGQNDLYIKDVLMLQALQVKGCNLGLLFSEISLNSEIYFRRKFDAHLCGDFYQVYDRENAAREFHIPGKNALTAEMSHTGGAAALQTYRCGIYHGCFRLYQGDSRMSVRDDYAKLRESLLAASLKDAVYEADYACLFMRINCGSKAAVVYRWLKFPRIALYNLDRGNEFVILTSRKHDFLAYPANPYIRFVYLPEEKVWRDAQYLALCTDNFLWNIKFGNPSTDRNSKILKYRVRPRYGKNSPEMKFYADDFAKEALVLADHDLAKKVMEHRCTEMEKKYVALSKTSYAIYETWERYRKGQSGYNDFAAALRRREADFENARLDMLRLRWKYIYAWARRGGQADAFAAGYAVSSMAYDGVNYKALEKFVKEELKH